MLVRKIKEAMFSASSPSHMNREAAQHYGSASCDVLGVGAGENQQDLPHAARSARPYPHHPVALAALCYVVPVFPGCFLLARERHNRFVRFHAAQSLVFFGMVAAGQLALYAVMMLAGGLIANDNLAALAGGLIVLSFLALGLAVVRVWLGLLADCVRGHARRLPVVGMWAERLECFSPRASWISWPQSGAR